MNGTYTHRSPACLHAEFNRIRIHSLAQRLAAAVTTGSEASTHVFVMSCPAVLCCALCLQEDDACSAVPPAVRGYANLQLTPQHLELLQRRQQQGGRQQMQQTRDEAGNVHEVKCIDDPDIVQVCATAALLPRTVVLHRVPRQEKLCLTEVGVSCTPLTHRRAADSGVCCSSPGLLCTDCVCGCCAVPLTASQMIKDVQMELSLELLNYPSGIRYKKVRSGWWDKFAAVKDYFYDQVTDCSLLCCAVLHSAMLCRAVLLCIPTQHLFMPPC